MSAPTFYLWHEESSDRYVIVRGHGVRAFLTRHQIPGMWSNTHKGHHVRAERVPDLAARAEHSGIRVIDKGAIR